MTAKYHTCGHRIWFEIRCNGLNLAPIFIDDEDTSPTCGKEIDLCPNCGEVLLQPGDLIDGEPFNSLTKPQILVMLRRLKDEIQQAQGGLTEEQIFLLIDVCHVLGLHPSDTS
jgi:hypothetical protein